jgi:hypothetical protein
MFDLNVLSGCIDGDVSDVLNRCVVRSGDSDLGCTEFEYCLIVSDTLIATASVESYDVFQGGNGVVSTLSDIEVSSDFRSLGIGGKFFDWLIESMLAGSSVNVFRLEFYDASNGWMTNRYLSCLDRLDLKERYVLNFDDGWVSYVDKNYVTSGCDNVAFNKL